MSDNKHVENYVTLQLGVPALQALLAQCGPEVKVQLAKSVMAIFAKTHLEFCLSEVVQAEIRKIVDDQIGLEKKAYKYQMNPSWTKFVKDQAKLAVEEAVTEQRKMIEACVADAVRSVDARLGHLTQEAVSNELDRNFRHKVSTAAAQAVEAALKELGCK